MLDDLNKKSIGLSRKNEELEVDMAQLREEKASLTTEQQAMDAKNK